MMSSFFFEKMALKRQNFSLIRHFCGRLCLKNGKGTDYPNRRERRMI